RSTYRQRHLAHREQEARMTVTASQTAQPQRRPRTLTDEQLAFWTANGYLAYDQPLLSPEELDAIGTRVMEIASGGRPDLPPEVFSVERAVVAGTVEPAHDYDRYRIMRYLHRYDD